LTPLGDVALDPVTEPIMLTVIATLATFSACSSSAPKLAVEVNARAQEVVLRTSSIDLPAAEYHEGYHGYHGHTVVTPLTPFVWPVDGWARGFRLRLLDCAGNEVSKTRMHHAIVLHLEQRELMYPIYERLMAFTQESEDIMLPRGVGMRIAKGASLGLLAAWMPVVEQPERIVLELTISYLAANTNPRPVDIVPWGLDVHYQPGGGASFDLPPGRSTLERVFEMPIDGRLLVAGAHMHDYAVSMVLSDAASGRTVTEIRTRRDTAGRVLSVDRKLYGVSGAGIKIEAGRRYRLAVTYDNPTGQVLTEGGMGILAGLLSPADLREWPALDKADPGFARDVEMFVRGGFLPSITAARAPQ